MAKAKKAAKKGVPKKTAPKKAVAKKAAPKKVVPKKTASRAIALDEETAELDNTTLNTVYIIDGSDRQVTLEVIPGDEGQMSDMDIALDDDSLADKMPDPFPETPIGTNKKLQGKVLRIRAIITDVLPDTDITSLTVKIKGGAADAVFPLGKKVSPNGSAKYICKIEFL